MVAWDPDAPRPLRWYPKVVSIWPTMVVLVPSAANAEVGVLGYVVATNAILDDDGMASGARVRTEDGRDGWFDIDVMADPAQSAA